MFSKKSCLLVLTVLMLAIASCGDDDANNPGLQAVDPDPTENVELDPTVVSNGLIIKDGVQETGNPPAPKGNLPFSMEYTKQTGLQTHGFDVTFDAPDNYAGAYIQIISTDGTPATDYWDVSLDPNKKSRTVTAKKTNRIFSTEKKNISFQEVDINFEDIIPPGKFCYIICVYDSNGNISQPQEVCVVIESWGGNPNLVGTWSKFKLEQTYQGITSVYFTADEYCNDPSYTIDCNNQNSVTADNYCDLTNIDKYTFNTDGTYINIYKRTVREIDDETTIENCEVSYIVEEENKTYTNNWAYNEEENKLILVYTYNGDVITNNETGEVVVQGQGVNTADVLEITTSSLITVDEYGDRTFYVKQ